MKQFHFYSHAPRGARRALIRQLRPRQHFYSHAPRGARLFSPGLEQFSHISTHTPLAGRDRDGVVHRLGSGDFYSHAPRGARLNARACSSIYAYFYSHAPRGARQQRNSEHHIHGYFYSHAPRGARRNLSRTGLRSSRFLLTRPSRGATWTRSAMPWSARWISTHTPLAGRDHNHQIPEEV